MATSLAASSATPAMTKTSWVAVPTVMSTTMLAVACAPGNAALMRKPGADDVAADARDRQERR